MNDTNNEQGENVMNLLEKWGFKIALSKISRRGIPWVVGLLSGPSVAGAVNTKLGSYGVSINVDPVALQTAIGAGLSLVSNWAKVKFNLKWL